MLNTNFSIRLIIISLYLIVGTFRVLAMETNESVFHTQEKSYPVYIAVLDSSDQYFPVEKRKIQQPKKIIDHTPPQTITEIIGSSPQMGGWRCYIPVLDGSLSESNEG